MSCLSKPLIAATALLALLGAQVFGLQRGFLCVCTGEVVETLAAHCQDTDQSCGHEHEVPHDHMPLKVKHEAQGKVSSLPQVQAPPLLAILDFFPVIALLQACPPCGIKEATQAPPGLSENPPASLLVAQCTVLLV